jgi:hypothetical protein
MEVASPLTFGHSTAGAKRHLPCSPGFVDSTNRSPFAMSMEQSEEFHQRSFKRRRFNMDESMEPDSENVVNQSICMSHATQQKSVFSPSNGEFRHGRFTGSLSFMGSLSRLYDVIYV